MSREMHGGNFQYPGVDTADDVIPPSWSGVIEHFEERMRSEEGVGVYDKGDAVAEDNDGQNHIDAERGIDLSGGLCERGTRKEIFDKGVQGMEAEGHVESSGEGQQCDCEGKNMDVFAGGLMGFEVKRSGAKDGRDQSDIEWRAGNRSLKWGAGIGDRDEELLGVLKLPTGSQDAIVKRDESPTAEILEVRCLGQ